MSGRFNTLYLGEAADAATELDDNASINDLRLALINALHRIDRLEKQFSEARNKS